MSTTTTTIPEVIEGTIKETVEKLGERVGSHIDLDARIEDGKRRLRSLDEKARALINEHPAACLVGALALGYLAARLARRERS